MHKVTWMGSAVKSGGRFDNSIGTGKATEYKNIARSATQGHTGRRRTKAAEAAKQPTSAGYIVSLTYFTGGTPGIQSAAEKKLHRFPQDDEQGQCEHDADEPQQTRTSQDCNNDI